MDIERVSKKGGFFVSRMHVFGKWCEESTSLHKSLPSLDNPVTIYLDYTPLSHL